MAVFISYSHADRRLAEKLGAHLVKHKANVWIDRWELRVGDSLIQRIQEAIQDADALIVLLSNASVSSEWCKKELSAGLVRELEERRVVVLPAILDDCQIPLFLRDKLYADFRTDFDEGLKSTLQSIARVTSDSLGRIPRPKSDIDWSVDWGESNGRVNMRITTIEPIPEFRYTVLTEVNIRFSPAATKRYKEYEREGLDWIYRLMVHGILGAMGIKDDLRILLMDNLPRSQKLKFNDPKTGISYEIIATSRRLGEDNGMDVLFNYGQQMAQISDGLSRTLRMPTAEEHARLRALVERGRGNRGRKTHRNKE